MDFDFQIENFVLVVTATLVQQSGTTACMNSTSATNLLQLPSIFQSKKKFQQVL